MSNIEVVSLSFYPIKSCGPTNVQEARFSPFGIEHDREWMLVGSNGQPITQRTNPTLALVRPRLQNGSLTIAAPGMGELPISLERDPDAEVVPVTLWKKAGSGTNEGPDAGKFFNTYLGKTGVRLLRIHQPRAIKLESRVDGAADHIAFADGYQLLLASADSMAELNRHLEDPATIDRFRANIVVEGAPAYDEDYWRKVRIGNLGALVARACSRCPMPNIDQQVGELFKQRPVTDALRATRQGFDQFGEKGEFFGQNLRHVFVEGTTVKVGDTVTIEERSDKRNWTLAA